MYLILSVQPACTHSIKCKYNTYQADVLRISVGCTALAEPPAMRARLIKTHYMLSTGNETAPCTSATLSVASSVGQPVRNPLTLSGRCRQCRGTTNAVFKDNDDNWNNNSKKTTEKFYDHELHE
jgi:hypothetical protein